MNKIVKGVRFSSNFANKNKKEYVKSQVDELKEQQIYLSDVVFYNINQYVLPILNKETNSQNMQNILCKEFKNRKYNRYWNVQKLQNQVLDQYVNRLSKINLDFKIQKEIVRTYYKRNTKNNKKGDVKSFSLKYKYAKNSNLLKFINGIKYLPFHNVDELNSKLLSILVYYQGKQDSKKIDRYLELIGLFNHYKENDLIDRIVKLVISKKNRLYSKQLRKQINFENQREFRVQSKLVIDKENKKFQYFLQLNKHLRLPVEYNIKYKEHRNIEQINFNSVLLGYNKNRIIIKGTKNYEYEDYYNFKQDGNIQSIDINSKHNLMQISIFDSQNNYQRIKMFTMDLPYEQIDKIYKTLLVLDKKGYQNLNKQEKVELHKLGNYMDFVLNKMVKEVLDVLEQYNVNIIVMEDLNLFKEKQENYTKKILHQDLNIQYNRLMRILKINSIKSKFRSQGEHRRIKVEFINPQYTSQRCSKCGYIDENNRKTQEDFVCLNCGFKENQDINATINIFEIYYQDVLGGRFQIHQKQKNVPYVKKKKLSRMKVKEILQGLSSFVLDQDL